MIAPNAQRHPVARVGQTQFTIRLLFAGQFQRRGFDLHMHARSDRVALRGPANFSERHQLHVDLAKPRSGKCLAEPVECEYYFAASMTPHAKRAPELPAGSVFKSSAFSCTTTDFPMIEFGPLRSSFPFQTRCPLPEASTSMLPKSRPGASGVSGPP